MRIDLKLGAVFVAGIAITLALTAIGGPLSPPAGPVASTYKTIDETPLSKPVGARFTPGDAEASFVIAAPGRYHLTENVFGGVGFDAISIEADGVILDLNGFSLQSFGGSGDGVTDNGTTRQRVQIRNGEIVGFSTGIQLDSSFYCVVEGVVARACSDDGVRAGEQAIVRDSHAVSNTSTGLTTGDSSFLEANFAVGNGSGGILTGQGSIARGNVLRANQSVGLIAGDASVVTQNASTENRFGFSVGGTSRVFDNTVLAYEESAVFAGIGSSVVENTFARFDADGQGPDTGSVLLNGPGVLIADNHVYGARSLISSPMFFDDDPVVIRNHLITNQTVGSGILGPNAFPGIVGPPATTSSQTEQPAANTLQVRP